MFKIILGIIFFLVGFYFLAKTEAILANFGRMEFFERYLGTEGGSRLGYKLVGLVLSFIGVILVTGLYGSFMDWMFGPMIEMMSGQGL